jgi:hypothetical protein
MSSFASLAPCGMACMTAGRAFEISRVPSLGSLPLGRLGRQARHLHHGCLHSISIPLLHPSLSTIHTASSFSLLRGPGSFLPSFIPFTEYFRVSSYRVHPESHTGRGPIAPFCETCYCWGATCCRKKTNRGWVPGPRLASLPHPTLWHDITWQPRSQNIPRSRDNFLFPLS